jgi:bifunctional non-homologous end joining protein LigD
MGLEGVVAKRCDSPYLAGQRTTAWVKVRNRLRQEFVVGGWSEGEGSRGGTVGALLLGHYGSKEDGRRLVYVGRCGSGLGGSTLVKLEKSLRALAGPRPFDSSADDETGGDVHFVKPKVVVEVEFSNLTREGLLRQAAFKGVRTDKDPRQVVWEQAQGKAELETDGPEALGGVVHEAKGAQAARAGRRGAARKAPGRAAAPAAKRKPKKGSRQ